MRKLFILIFITAVFISGFIGFKFLSKKEYKIANVEKKTIVKTVYASGYVKPENQVDIKSQVSGYIKHIYVSENQNVKKGDIIAVIDSAVLDKQIKKLDSQIQSIKEKLQPDSNFRKTFLQKLQIEKNMLDFLKSKLNRRLPLYSKKQVPEEEIQLIKNQIKIQEEKIELIENQYLDKIEDLESKLKILSLEKEKLLEKKKKYIITSPINGTVLKTYAKQGEYLNHMIGKNTIATVGDLTRLEIVLEVDEEYISSIKKGLKVLIYIDAYPEKIFKGKITKILKKANPKKRTVEVKVHSKNLPSLPSGTSVEANIITEKKQALVVPAIAVKNGKIKILKNGKIKQIKVKTGTKIQDYVEILEGLKEKDKVLLP